MAFYRRPAIEFTLRIVGYSLILAALFWVYATAADIHTDFVYTNF